MPDATRTIPTDEERILFRAMDCVEWSEENDEALPRADSDNHIERELGEWIERQCLAFEERSLPEEVVTYLDAYYGRHVWFRAP